MKQLASVLLMFLSGLSFAQDSIEISLNKHIYTGNDKFHAQLSNDKENPVSYIGLSIQKLINDKWVLSRTDVGCPCRAKCKKKATVLENKDSSNETWDFKDNICSFIIPGEYRAVVFGGWNQAKNESTILGKSSVFRIK
jgi:hypothetical protein